MKQLDLQVIELPLICICIPTYNAAKTIRQTLESIIVQSYSNMVIHIADNASTDDTIKVIETIKDPRVTIHRYSENIGGEGNFTRCIELATGKYTAIFHADDIYELDMVAKQVAYLEANLDVGSVFTQARIIDEHGKSLGVTGCVPGNKIGVARFDFSKLMKTMLFHHNFLVCPSVMVRTEIYKNTIKVWGSSLFKSASDVDTWLRLANNKTIAVLDEKLMRYRISSAQYSHMNRNRTERAEFFLVMDHYLTKPEVLDFLTKDDIRHFGWLERHERVARAFNLLVLGRSTEAKKLLRGFFSRDTFIAAMYSRRGLVTLAGGSLVLFLMFFGMENRSAAIIKSIKKISWK